MIDLLAQESSGGSPFTFLIFLAPLALLFWLSRSQKKRANQQRTLQESAEIGEEILTTSGIIGTIVGEDADEGTVIVEIAPGTRVTMVRGGIARRMVEESDEDASGPIGS